MKNTLAVFVAVLFFGSFTMLSFGGLLKPKKVTEIPKKDQEIYMESMNQTIDLKLTPSQDAYEQSDIKLKK